MRRHFMLCLLLSSSVFIPRPVNAQLRTLDPPMFHAFDNNANFLVTGGIGALNGQRTSLAGTRGRLEELGLYSITWRSGRVAMTASGTAIWRMSNETSVEAPVDRVGSRHEDAGSVLLETAARLTPADSRVLWLLRFGTRLPITSLSSGLERDESDFFATLALRSQGALWIAGEAGTSINGRTEPLLGQTDFVTYSVGAGYRGNRAPVIGDAWIVGQDDLHSNRFRGTEDLRELRVGVRSRGVAWIGGQWIHGLTEFSPSNGFRITAGVDGHFNHIPVLGWR